MKCIVNKIFVFPIMINNYEKNKWDVKFFFIYTLLSVEIYVLYFLIV